MKISSFVLPLLTLAFTAQPKAAMAACTPSSPSDFKIPDFGLILPLPPDKNIQILLTLLESVIPPIQTYETPMAIRFTNLFDTMSWNCVATYHASYKSALPQNNDNQDKYKLIRSQDATTYTTDARQLCGVYAFAAALPGFFDEDVSATETFLSGFPAQVLGLTESNIGIPSDLLDSCPDPMVKQCLEEYATCHGFTPAAMGAIVAYQALAYSRTDGWNSEGKLAKAGRTCK